MSPPQDPPNLESENHHEKGERSHTIIFGFDQTILAEARYVTGLVVMPS
jgi:hypothetical protein